jgi:hypothetical protein
LDDLNKERIKFNTEIIKLLTVLFITTGGAALALVLEGLEAIFERILGIAGMVFSVTSGFLAIVLYKNTLRKLK